ncbi:MAG: hypothetical protein RL577_732 [Bacteroidota bacterium]
MMLGLMSQPVWSFTDHQKHSILLEFQKFFLNEFGHSAQVSLIDAIDLGDSLLINPNGTHYLYSYKFNRLGFLRLDRSTFHGHNFGRKLFWYNNHIYALGGYGFWVDHSKLIRFNWTTREWDLILTKGPSPGGSPLLSFIRHDSLFCIRSIFRGQGEEVSRIVSQMWVLDLHELKWSNYSFDPNIGLESSDYRLSAENENWFVGTTLPRSQELIVNKRTGKFYLNTSGPPLMAIPELGITGVNLMNNSKAMTCILGDSLVIFYEDSLSYGRANLATFVFEYCREENVDLNNLNGALISEIDRMAQMSFVSERLVYWLGLLLLLFLYIFEKQFNRKDSKFQFNEGVFEQTPKPTLSPEEEIALALHKKGSQQYSQDELDILLNIQDFDYDSRKLKRSRIITELNKNHEGILDRKRDPSDKRKFIYTVDHLKFKG